METSREGERFLVFSGVFWCFLVFYDAYWRFSAHFLAFSAHFLVVFGHFLWGPRPPFRGGAPASPPPPCPTTGTPKCQTPCPRGGFGAPIGPLPILDVNQLSLPEVALGHWPLAYRALVTVASFFHRFGG